LKRRISINDPSAFASWMPICDNETNHFNIETYENR
jgi:hypothetical protein